MCFNLRIFNIHIQVFRNFKIKPICKWYDLWIGVFIDTNKCCTYIFLLPTLGIQLIGFRLVVNQKYSFKKDSIIRLIQCGNNYYPMQDYNNI